MWGAYAGAARRRIHLVLWRYSSFFELRPPSPLTAILLAIYEIYQQMKQTTDNKPYYSPPWYEFHCDYESHSRNKFLVQNFFCGNLTENESETYSPATRKYRFLYDLFSGPFSQVRKGVRLLDWGKLKRTSATGVGCWWARRTEIL